MLDGFSPGEGLGYFLGLGGGLMMLSILLYSLRKRFAFMSGFGSMRAWFGFHIFAGITGPLMVAMHTGFGIRSMNAMVATLAMLAVFVSGIVGRFLLRMSSEKDAASIWTKLFSWWHFIHLPFLWLLFFSGVVHVIAVHMY